MDISVSHVLGLLSVKVMVFLARGLALTLAGAFKKTLVA